MGLGGSNPVIASLSDQLAQLAQSLVARQVRSRGLVFLQTCGGLIHGQSCSSGGPELVRVEYMQPGTGLLSSAAGFGAR